MGAMLSTRGCPERVSLAVCEFASTGLDPWKFSTAWLEDGWDLSELISSHGGTP